MESRAKRLIKILTRNVAAMALAILALVVLAKATLALGINDDYIRAYRADYRLFHSARLHGG